jgi:site-specific recombinase XerD
MTRAKSKQGEKSGKGGRGRGNFKSHNEGRKFPPEPLTHEEVIKLMNQCSKRAPTGKRDRALIVVLWRGQLRVKEALDLKVADFDPKACTLRVLKGKGSKARVAVIDQQAAAELTAWLEARKALGFNGHKPIFCTLKGGPLSTAQVREMLPRRARKAGIEKRVHAHGLRHTGASELAQEGIALLDIQEQLGHSNPSTTDRYLHKLNPVGRAERLRNRTWQG